MSLQQSRTANLSGYGEATFPPGVTEVARAFTAKQPGGLPGAELDAAARRCTGYKGLRDVVRTADDYAWFRLLEFEVEGGMVAVAIPRTTDWSRADGTQCDRSPAVYIRGAVKPATVAALLDELVRQMRA